jgi:hypothetical protein
MDCATYTSGTYAIAGALRNWINYVKEQIDGSGDQKAKKPDGTVISSLAGLTDEQIGELKILGKREGHFVTDNGTTTALVAPIQAYELTLWWYELPAAKYMVGVEHCTVLPFDPAWIPPEPEPEA